MKLSLWRLLIAAFVTLAAGLALKYFELNTYIIILGFRFHLGALLPFAFITGTALLPYIKQELVNPYFKRWFFFLMVILIPLLLINGVLYLLKYIELGDPEYFYEFGLSSVFDFPIYLIWNAPQFIMLYMFLRSVSESIKFKFITVFIFVVLLFGYEFVPFNKLIVSYTSIGAFVAAAIIASLLVTKYRNIYWFCITMFALPWSVVLLAGSISKAVINIFFAAQYRNWEGLLDINKPVNEYYVAGYLLVAFIIMLTGLGLSPKKSTYQK